MISSYQPDEEAGASAPSAGICPLDVTGAPTCHGVFASCLLSPNARPLLEPSSVVTLLPLLQHKPPFCPHLPLHLQGPSQASWVWELFPCPPRPEGLGFLPLTVLWHVCLPHRNDVFIPPNKCALSIFYDSGTLLHHGTQHRSKPHPCPPGTETLVERQTVDQEVSRSVRHPVGMGATEVNGVD